MKNIIRYWKGNEKILIFFLLVSVPFLFIHEISHLLINWILGVKQKINSFYFMERVNGKFKTGLSIRILKGNKVAIIIGSLAPTIVWLCIMIFSGYNTYENHSVLSALFFIYGLLGIKTANCSKVDLKTVMKCMGL